MDILKKLKSDEQFISGIDHVAIVVKDMDRSIKFYSEILNLVVLYDGRGDGGDKKSFLGKKEKSFVALTEDSQKNIDEAVVESVSHIAFRVENVEEAKEILESRGIEFVEIKVSEDGKSRAYHFLDPDGFELEIYGGTGEIIPTY
jgi:catechol 2,3-dioxygenase-like lactoylglutathione lyase family enzyme